MRSASATAFSVCARICASRPLGCSIRPPVSISTQGTRPTRAVAVLPVARDARARRRRSPHGVRVSTLNSVDLPTLGRPTMATIGSMLAAYLVGSAAPHAVPQPPALPAVPAADMLAQRAIGAELAVVGEHQHQSTGHDRRAADALLQRDALGCDGACGRPICRSRRGRSKSPVHGSSQCSIPPASPPRRGRDRSPAPSAGGAASAFCATARCRSCGPRAPHRRRRSIRRPRCHRPPGRDSSTCRAPRPSGRSRAPAAPRVPDRRPRTDHRRRPRPAHRRRSAAAARCCRGTVRPRSPRRWCRCRRRRPATRPLSNPQIDQIADQHRRAGAAQRQPRHLLFGHPDLAAVRGRQAVQLAVDAAHHDQLAADGRRATALRH